MINQQINIPIAEIRAFCERYPIRKLSLFGSVLRDDFTLESDVDVLVEFEPNSGVTYLDMARMELELGAILGQQIDLREPEELSRFSRERVLGMAMPVYERA